MITLEQVERLREKANVSFEEAKAALEATNGDLLDALIYLERKGRVSPPAGDGYYSSQNSAREEEPKDTTEKEPKRNGESFSDMVKRFGRACGKVIGKGNHNFLEAERAGNTVFSLPVTVVVVLLIFVFWVVIPLFILSLFFGFRYHFRGQELGKDAVNKVMDGVSNTADDIKKSVSGENK